MSNKVTIKVNINNTIYPVTCEIGEEDKLINASNEVNKAIEELSSISSGISETRLLAMTSLVLADKLSMVDKPKLANAVFFKNCRRLFGF